jgi:hypothetical protein
VTASPASPTRSRPGALGALRATLTYVLPSLAVFLVVLSGLWLVPDGFAGMYGNHDGRWLSWTTRGILQWSGFLDFSPFSPLTGTGSPFLPNLPWLNPGAMALALPASLPVRHLASMLVYLAELSASLYLLYRHLEFSREQSYLATILYVGIFFIPFWGLTGALPWYSLAPMNAHLVAGMNVATIALVRVGHERLAVNVLWACVFLAASFVVFASSPISSMTYVPVYGVLWIALLVPCRATRHRAVRWRCGAMAFALLVLCLIGVPRYLTAIAMTSARGDAAPPIFHPGWQLLSPAYWRELVSATPVCHGLLQLMCPSSIIGWFEMAVLGGGIVLAVAGSGVKRRYGAAIAALLAVLHVYALLHMGTVLGRLHVVSPPFLMWAFFPLAPPAVIAAGSAVGASLIGRRAASSAWLPAATGSLMAVVAIFAWVQLILPYQPRLPGHGPFGLPPIAHIPASEGPIVEYLRRHIGLHPGSAFRGYATTFLGAPDGLVRSATNTPADVMTWDAYVASGNILFDQFGTTFQKMDLWNGDIPTFEEYGQSVSRQMHYFNRDLLAAPQDRMDPLPASILLYRFRPPVLGALGIRFVVADGTLADPSIELVMTETGKAGARVNLYEIKGADLGQFSPTQVAWVSDYRAAVKALREGTDLAHRVVLLGAPERPLELVAATRAMLLALGDGYRVTASAPGTALLVLPVQFSHCWQVERADPADPPRILRANVVQTGILFKDSLDVRLRFDFEPWRASCRLQDAQDLTRFVFK